MIDVNILGMENGIDVYYYIVEDGSGCLVELCCLVLVEMEVCINCMLNVLMIVVICNDNGMLSDLNDDIFIYIIEVMGINIGMSYLISGDDMQVGLSYGVVEGVFGFFLVSGGDLMIMIIDNVMGSCQLVDVMVIVLVICSFVFFFEVQISQFCDGDSFNEGIIIYVIVDNVLSGNWVFCILNNFFEVWVMGVNGSLQEVVMVLVGIVLEIVDGNNIIGSDVVMIMNLIGGLIFFIIFDDDIIVEGDNVFGC